MKIARNDVVEIIAGADKGKQGRVLHAVPGSDRVVVEKVRVVKRHRKQVQGQAGGGIVEMEAPIHVSNVKLVSKASGRGGKD
jgi:large subunit ribosomal protein L24